jgi:hypothetical protein
MRLAIAVSCIAVLLFDTTVASIAKFKGIAYVWFTIPDLIMYFLIGLVLMRRLTSAPKVLIVLLTASIVEATLGWMISAEIGPGKLVGETPVGFIFDSLAAVVTTTAVGMLGVWISKLTRQKA